MSENQKRTTYAYRIGWDRVFGNRLHLLKTGKTGPIKGKGWGGACPDHCVDVTKPDQRWPKTL